MTSPHAIARAMPSVYALAQELCILKRDGRLTTVEGHECLPIDDAPRDGRMVQLLVRQLGEEEWTDPGRLVPWTPLADATVSWTVGFNSLDNDGEDAWQFVGWCWSHDEFVVGTGTPVGWLPLHWERP